MGLYNLLNFIDEDLCSSRCLLCGHIFIPVNENLHRPTFDYRCSHCNPEVLISISGSFITDGYHNILKQDAELKEKIIQYLRTSNEEEFYITTGTFRQLLQEE